MAGPGGANAAPPRRAPSLFPEIEMETGFDYPLYDIEKAYKDVPSPVNPMDDAEREAHSE